MGQAWWRVAPDMGEAAARALIYTLGAEDFANRVLLAWTRSSAATDDAAWRALATLPQRWQAPVFPLKAADFIARGIGKGPMLGQVLAAAEEKWIAAGFPAEADALAAIAEAAAGSYAAAR
jgi:poly(A) polymerase